MQEIWHRIEQWLAIHAPTVLADLQPGASEQAIAQAEKLLEITFPEDVKTSFRLHNGQTSNSPWMLDGWEFLSLDRICDEWSVWKDLHDSGDFADILSTSSDPIRSDWWNPAWIPLTYDGAGNHHCLDLAPTAGGQIGQIISMWHDADERTLIAPSFRAWLNQFANDLEADIYILSPNHGGLVRKERS